MSENVEPKNKIKRSRAKYDCPDQLSDLIQMESLVPKGEEFIFNLRMAYGLFTNAYEVPVNRKVIVLGEFSKETVFDHLPDGIGTLLKAYAKRWYPDSEEWLSILWSIDDLGQFHKNMDSLREYRSSEDEYHIKGIWGMKITATIRRDKNGIERFSGFSSLIGKFQIDRLRFCEICEKIFWAKRIESSTCSPKCFNNLRQRRYRSLSKEEKEEINQKRSANRLYKNKLKSKEDKK